MKIIYMGTPAFAVSALTALADAGHQLVACFTQPDKPKGRGKTLLPTEVKVKALELGIPVYQPQKIREQENIDIIKEYNPDVIVVAAYGQILPESILDIPHFGCINIHASLLPKYRGAAPIEWSIINGESETGVTTMYMEKGLDTGDMLDRTVVKIEDEDTGLTLHDKLAAAGADLIVETLKKLETGEAVRIPQDDEISCYAPMLTKNMGNLDFTKSSTELWRLIRGLQPWPCADTVINGKKVKIYEAVPEKASGECGKVIEVTKKSFTIACGEGSLRILKLQPEGKKLMDAAAFLAGNKIETGMIL
jgi:methionyl-tRNA formyltransferase